MSTCTLATPCPGEITADDYRLPAEIAVRHVTAMMERYAEPERYRATIEGGSAAGR